MISIRFYTIVILGLSVIFSFGPALAKTEGRIALVIGNGAYKSSPLLNPTNDASDLAQVLRDLDFSVTIKLDADHRSMEAAIHEFGKALRSGGVGLFYYAGHGLQVKGRNYLIPIDADIRDEFDVKFEAVDAGRILGKMDSAGNDMNIIILDACRNNPFSNAFRSYDRGLAIMDAPAGSILAYSTAPGSVAADGDGRNGVYTFNLLKQIKVPGLTIEQCFKRIRADVIAESNNSQIPWESSSLTGDFFFVQNKKIKAASNYPSNNQTAELLYWESVKDSKEVIQYKLYIDKYPNGLFKDLAMIYINKLEDAKSEINEKKRSEHKIKENKNNKKKQSVENGTKLIDNDEKNITWNKSVKVSSLDHQLIETKKTDIGEKIVNNKKDIFYDKRTGLEWASGSDIDINWDKAKSWASKLDLDGDGWKMPSLKELENLFILRLNRNDNIPLFETSGLFVWSKEFIEKGYGEPPYGFCYDITRNGSGRIPIKKSKGMRAFAVRFKPRHKLFVTDGNGILYDTRTGLEWASRSDTDINWDKAKSWASKLDLDGGGWKMPSLKELENLFILRLNRNDNIPLFETSGSFVWSREFIEKGYGEPPYGFCYDITRNGSGRIPIKKSKGMRAFALRFKPRHKLFVTESNGILYDTRTGLEWASGSDIDINWDKAKSWVSKLDLDGGGWRMPSLKELENLFILRLNRNDKIPLFETSGLFVWSREFIEKGYGEPPSGFCYDITRNGSGRIPIKKSKGMRAFAVRKVD